MVLGSQAWAQAVVDRTRIVLDNWTFVPINSTSATGTRVHSFLALKNKADAVGGNIVSVWFLRPDQGGGEWDAKAWESTDQWDAIKTVAAEMSLPTDESIWPTTDAKTLGAPTDTGTAYAKGFLVGDLNGALLEDEPVRDWIIEALVGSGYTVADISFDKSPPGSPTPGYWLDAMAAAVDAEKVPAVGPGGGYATFAAQVATAPCDLKPKVTWSGGWELVSCTAWNCLGPSGADATNGMTYFWKCTYWKEKVCTWSRRISVIDACGIPWSMVQTMVRTDALEYVCTYTPAQMVDNENQYGNGCTPWATAAAPTLCLSPCGASGKAVPGPSPTLAPPLPTGASDPDNAPPVVTP